MSQVPLCVVSLTIVLSQELSHDIMSPSNYYRPNIQGILAGVAGQFAVQFGANTTQQYVCVAVSGMENCSLANARLLHCYTISWETNYYLRQHFRKYFFRKWKIIYYIIIRREFKNTFFNLPFSTDILSIRND